MDWTASGFGWGGGRGGVAAADCLLSCWSGLLGVELVVLHLGGEVAEVEDGAAGEGAGALDGVLELADVAGPVVLHEQVQGFVGEGVGEAVSRLSCGRGCARRAGGCRRAARAGRGCGG